MNITNDARDILKPILNERNASGIRLYFAGYGWGGPSIGLALDEPEAEDSVLMINEIQVAIEPGLEDYSEGVLLEYDKRRNGLVLIGSNDC